MNSGNWHANNALQLDTNDDLVTNGGNVWRSGASAGMPTGDGKIHIDRNTAYSSSASDDQFICYAWKAVAGVSAFGTHEGQISSVGSTLGEQGNCGFKPRFVMIKSIDQDRNWMIFDGFRDGTDDFEEYLGANTTTVGTTYSGADITVTANGFTTGSDSSVGGSSENYISIAFA